MAYEKQTWANGDVITAEKLNHMEDGIAQGGTSGIVIVDLSGPSISSDDLNKITNAYSSKEIVLGVFDEDSYGFMMSASMGMGGLTAVFESTHIYGTTMVVATITASSSSTTLEKKSASYSLTTA